MADATQLVNAVKLAALAASDAAKPMQLCFGQVVSGAPLQIAVEQKLTLGEAQLILTRSVTDYQAEVTVSHYTEYETQHRHEIADTYTGGGTCEPSSHRHAYRGKKTVTVHGKLKEGERVVLARMQGGQKYLVLDRI